MGFSMQIDIKLLLQLIPFQECNCESVIDNPENPTETNWENRGDCFATLAKFSSLKRVI